jgi:hypothetical protein
VPETLGVIPRARRSRSFRLTHAERRRASRKSWAASATENFCKSRLRKLLAYSDGKSIQIPEDYEIGSFVVEAEAVAFLGGVVIPHFFLLGREAEASTALTPSTSFSTHPRIPLRGIHQGQGYRGIPRDVKTGIDRPVLPKSKSGETQPRLSAPTFFHKQ